MTKGGSLPIVGTEVHTVEVQSNPHPLSWISGGPPGSRSRHLGIRSRGLIVLGGQLRPNLLLESGAEPVHSVPVSLNPRSSVAVQ
jgi:hypothetical protein